MNDQIESVDKEPIKLVDKAKPAQPQQQTFPFMNVQVNQQGLVVTTHFTAVSAFTQVVPMETIKQALPAIKEALKNEQTILQTIQQVQRSRVH